MLLQTRGTPPNPHSLRPHVKKRNPPRGRFITPPRSSLVQPEDHLVCVFLSSSLSLSLFPPSLPPPLTQKHFTLCNDFTHSFTNRKAIAKAQLPEKYCRSTVHRLAARKCVSRRAADPPFLKHAVSQWRSSSIPPANQAQRRHRRRQRVRHDLRQCRTSTSPFFLFFW